MLPSASFQEEHRVPRGQPVHRAPLADPFSSGRNLSDGTQPYQTNNQGTPPSHSAHDPFFPSFPFPSSAPALSSPTSYAPLTGSTLDHSPPLTRMPTQPSSTANPSGSAYPFSYQPPPTRQQLQQQHPNTSHRISLGSGLFLEPEPASPGASTLIGSPVTPQHDSQRPFSWLQSAVPPQPSPLSSTHPNPFDMPVETSPLPPSSARATVSTSRVGLFGSRKGSSKYYGQDPSSTSSVSEDGLDQTSVGPASAARTLGYYDQGSTSPHSASTPHPPSSHRQYPSNSGAASTGKWEPHVSVLMDDISLESFTPSNTPPPKSKEGFYKNGGGPRDGSVTPQSEMGRSSNTSMITLLAQSNNFTSNSSSATLFGFGFGNGSYKKQLQQEKLQDQDRDHQVIPLQENADGKIYSKRPKPKQFGKKGKGGGGDGGNGDRKALFSNERTFVHWIKFGIVLGMTGLTLCNFGTLGSLAFRVGAVVLLIAMSALGYAAAIFHFRDRSLSRRLRASLAKKKAKKGEKAAGSTSPMTEQEKSEAQQLMNPIEGSYYDRVGPTILCSALVFAYSINFYLSLTGGVSVNAEGLSFYHQQ